MWNSIRRVSSAGVLLSALAAWWRSVVRIAGLRIGGLGLGVTISALSAAWYSYWNSHAKKYPESGYTPPSTSWAGELLFYLFSRLYAFVAIGRVKVVYGKVERGVRGNLIFHHSYKKPKPIKGRAIYLANHQYRPDFSLLRRAADGHFRILMSANELKGALGIGSAFTGAISLAYGSPDDGKKAQDACAVALAADNFRIEKSLAISLFVLTFLSFAAAFYSGHFIIALIAAVISAVVAMSPGSQPALGIFPEGSLLPDNPQLSEHFRPGAVRIASGAALLKGDELKFVPMAFRYKLEPDHSDWSQAFFGKFRKFNGKRHPSFYPEFKVELDTVPEAERPALVAKREEMMRQYRNSLVTLHGAVLVRGDEIKLSELPSDPIEAMAELRDRVALLYEVAKKH